MRGGIHQLTTILTNGSYSLVLLLVKASLPNSQLPNGHHLEFVLIVDDAMLTYITAQ